MTLPREFQDWKLMPARSFPSLYSDVGTVAHDLHEGGEFRIGRSEVALTLYLFTDLPHPDDPSWKATYRLDLRPALERLNDHLLEPTETSPTQETTDV